MKQILFIAMCLFALSSYGQRFNHFGGGSFHTQSFRAPETHYTPEFHNSFRNETRVQPQVFRPNPVRPQVAQTIHATPQFVPRRDADFDRFRMEYRFNHRRFYYYSGFYYDRWYRPCFPPIGFYITTLPFGYWSFTLGGFPYYYYGGVFYQNYNDGYQVVDPPVGAVVPTLPEGYKTIVLNNMTYYVVGNVYYQEIEVDGQVKYQVVSK
jgi:Family of unknown function (DUF6515)